MYDITLDLYDTRRGETSKWQIILSVYGFNCYVVLETLVEETLYCKWGLLFLTGRLPKGGQEYVRKIESPRFVNITKLKKSIIKIGGYTNSGKN